MSPVKKWIKSCARFMLPLAAALAVATPSFAQVLNDSEEPGSAIVFPKFLRGTQTVDGVVVPATEIELGVVCPIGLTCAEHQAVKIRFTWVCPGFEDFNTKLICRANNFDVFASINGKVVFNPNNMTMTGDFPVNVPIPSCQMGYLIGYVINPANDQPIVFNGLVGDGVVRESGTAVATYSAIPIQAVVPATVTPLTAPPWTPVQTVPDTITGGTRLAFDGAPGHYAQVTGVIIGDVKFDNPTASSAFPIASTSYLVLLTLDVRTDFPNLPVELNINWWNESNATAPTSPLSEKLLSTSWEFVCWTEVPLTMIDPNLTQAQMGSRKGVFVSSPAQKFPFAGISDTAGTGTTPGLGGPVTLLGLVEVMESGNSRGYFTATQNNSRGVTTFFTPE